MGPRTGLDEVGMRKILPLPELELGPFSPPGRRQSLYRLSYPGSIYKIDFSKFLNIAQRSPSQVDNDVTSKMFQTQYIQTYRTNSMEQSSLKRQHLFN
jgi:hypothetical protein